MNVVMFSEMDLYALGITIKYEDKYHEKNQHIYSSRCLNNCYF